MPRPDTGPLRRPARLVPTRRRPPRPRRQSCASPRPAPLPRPKFVLHAPAQLLLAHGAAVARAFGYGPGHPRWPAPFCGAFWLLHAGQRAGRRRAGVCPLPVFDAAASAREIRVNTPSPYLRQQRGSPGIMRARPRPATWRRRGCSASPASPRRWTACGPGAAAGRAADGLVRIERTPGAGRRPADDAGLAMSARLLPGGALVHPEARVRARDPESGAVLRAGTVGRIEIRSPSLMLGYLDNPGSHRPRVHGRRLLQDRRPGLCLERAAVRVPGAHGRLAAAGGLPGQSGRDRAGGRVAARRARCQVVGATRADKTVPYAFVLLQPGARPTPRAGPPPAGRDGGLQGARRLHRAGCLPVH